MNELKRCPFCGGEAEIFETHEGQFGIIHSNKEYLCPISDSEMFQGNWLYDTKEEAINAWNNRKPLERVIERLEERIRILDNTSDINYPSVDVAIKETERIIKIIKEELM